MASDKLAQGVVRDLVVEPVDGPVKEVRETSME